MSDRPLYDRLSREQRQQLQKARQEGAAAAERLIRAGTEGDKVELVLGKNGKLHPKGYIRDGFA